MRADDQIKHLIKVDQMDEKIQTAMDQHTPKFEELFVAGLLKETKRVKLKPWPQKWDIDLDGDWETQAGAWLRSDLDRDECENKEAIAKPTAERRVKQRRQRMSLLLPKSPPRECEDRLRQEGRRRSKQQRR